ncbi:shikimate dehydrogenase [Schauerella aestuarii]|uniref:shikimate dehydrogenase n=1 Tax=Schauerella aestuarii TaxID=2511204 RepID=UPI00192737CB|nr:shikimate dehydrogenase [Achromobacter aestuarii]MYZ42724.1 shikimate dehydrogenase [Achromobacter aestuarii]
MGTAAVAHTGRIIDAPHAGAVARFAVIGHPVTHSRSPDIHAAFAAQTGIALSYDRRDAPEDAFVPSATAFFEAGGTGLNVTVPFKHEAFALAGSRLSERAQRAGAVNTLWMEADGVHGCNTDGIGLVADLRRLGRQLEGKRILMVGAGGAARGVLHPLLATGCAALHVANRTPARAQALAALDDSGRVTAGDLASAAQPEGWDIVINASASSLGDAPPDLPAGLYAPGALAYDMMYGAQPTPFMRQATADGAHAAADGLGMLVGQAAESFFIWHGIRPDPAPVLDALRRSLGKRA